MSFVNLLADDVWSEADIVARTEAIVRSQFSAIDEQILNRKVTGQMLRQYTLTEDEQAELGAFAAATEAARQQGDTARADMALLAQAMDVEAGTLDPATVTQDVADLVAQRAAARAAAEPTPEPTQEPQP
jgi:hypothetical protein